MVEDKQQIEDWAPLIMEGRDPNQQLAVTREATGDVDWRRINTSIS